MATESLNIPIRYRKWGIRRTVGYTHRHTVDYTRPTMEYTRYTRQIMGYTRKTEGYTHTQTDT